MSWKDTNYQVVYRDEVLELFVDGGWVLFQRPKSFGGGFWLGRTYNFVFMIEIERPVSLREGIEYINTATFVEAVAHEFDDEQIGLPF